MGQSAILSSASSIPLACQSCSLGRCPLPDLCSPCCAREAFHETEHGLNSYEIYLYSVERWSTAAKPQALMTLESTFVSLWYWLSSVDSRWIPSCAVRCVSSTEQPARPAADDSSPGLQEDAELAGKRLQLAAGVNNLPYAPVGVSSQPTHYFIILHVEIT